jgi:mobilome CxxCx(11)CxxC protein
MALQIDDMRREAWSNVVHAQGTYAVFARRASRLKALTDLRDWFGLLAIPATTAFVATAEFTQGLAAYRQDALRALIFAALVQALLAGWSLVRRWDDQRAYCSRAMRDSYEMKVAWQDIGKADVADMKAAYELRKAQQKIIDSHDIERDITDKEKMFGMRSGLLELQKACVGCGVIPTSRKLPLLVLSPRCAICGGKGNDRGQENRTGNQGVSSAH